MTIEINTILGVVTVTDVSMGRAAGYGQYSIKIAIRFDGRDKIISVHSTDSQLYDRLQDVDSDKAAFLARECKYLIEREVEHHVNSL
jgi:hypothetical protein